MLVKQLSDKDKKILISFLSKAYMNTKRRLEIQKIQGIKEQSGQYKGDLESIYFIESTIDACDETSQLILKKEFFSNKEMDWYLGYFSRSSFYRLKKRAIDEFIDCLNI